MSEEISSDEFKMLLISSGENPDYASWDGFTKLIQGAINMNSRMKFNKDFVDEYSEWIDADDLPGLTRALRMHQMDNYIFASLAAFTVEIPKSVPLVAWAAENKRLYPGWHGECVNLRTLLLMGYDVDAQDPASGNTALHCMCALQWGPGVHLQAIGYLLNSEADCNIKNMNGDTPVTYLAGAFPWSDDVHNAFGLLLKGGGNPFIPSNDGKTAMDLLRDNQRDHDQSPNRAAVIEYLEMMNDTPNAKPARTAARL